MRQETSQLTVPGAPEQKSSTTTGATPRKKKSIGIRALSAKQRKDDNIRALLKEHLGEIRALLYLEKSVPVEVSCLKEPLASERIKELGLFLEENGCLFYFILLYFFLLRPVHADDFTFSFYCSAV